MVIVDAMKLPPKKIMISIFVLILSIILTVFGYLYKQKVKAEELKKAQQQKIKKEQSDRSGYESTAEAIFNSPNVNSGMQLYNSLLKDFSFMNIAGWKEGEVLCTINSCNIRFSKFENRIFEYVSIKKGENTYEPVFNEKEMTYQSLIYEIDMKANLSFKENMNNLNACTDFISNTYQLNSLLSMSSKSKQKLEITLPNEVFRLGKEYEWATLSKLKKGSLKYKTPDFYTVNYIKDKYMGQLLTFDRLMVNKGEIDITFSYYCF